jgi:aminoglycoside 6'-N-acetyltransferase I
LNPYIVQIVIEACVSVDHPGWLGLRDALWPDGQPEEHLDEMHAFLAEPERYVQYVARLATDGTPVGLVEAAQRRDYVNGTQTSPVVFLEGIYVPPAFRRNGIARQLLAQVEAWARAQGCCEFASDASLENRASHVFHARAGFRETERVVYFVKRID